MTAARGVELLEKLGEQFGVARIGGAVEDEVLLAEQLAAAHHEDLHACLAVGTRHRDQVHVDARAPHDLLRFDRAPHRDDAVAQPRRGFEVVVFGRVGHLVLQPRDQRVVMAFEKEQYLVDELVVLFLRLVADARREAALDMVLQARPPPLAVDRFAAGAQREDDADQVDQLAQAGGVRVRSEVARAIVAHHAREDDPRKRLVGHLQIWEALVVARAAR